MQLLNFTEKLVIFFLYIYIYICHGCNVVKLHLLQENGEYEDIEDDSEFDD